MQRRTNLLSVFGSFKHGGSVTCRWIWTNMRSKMQVLGSTYKNRMELSLKSRRIFLGLWASCISHNTFHVGCVFDACLRLVWSLFLVNCWHHFFFLSRVDVRWFFKNFQKNLGFLKKKGTGSKEKPISCQSLVHLTMEEASLVGEFEQTWMFWAIEGVWWCPHIY